MKKMNLLSVVIAAAMLSPAAFAETGVRTLQIDNVANVYGRAGVPAVKTIGAVVTRGSDVNLAGRSAAPANLTTVLQSAGQDGSRDSGRS